mgnify:CR=1 FL=1
MTFLKKKKTKIVATIGPATENAPAMTALAKAGMNVIRLNFSHGSYEEHRKSITLARAIAKKLGMPIAVLQDLQGPKVRIGDFYKERVMLKKGSIFTLTTKPLVGDEAKVHVNYARLPQKVRKGVFILLDDGKKKLRVISVGNNNIVCRVVAGGETKGRRGVNVPGVPLSLSSLTAKDKKDLAFGIAHDVDFVALSFVRSPKDIRELRAILTRARKDIGIIAKIESAEAVENIDAIIALSDGIMVARGDLAIEVPAEDVPLIQKMIIQKCNEVGKPVITATQMLESMITSPVPTRAEVSDVANSILDGTDAVMLSEETTLGAYPVEAVTVMANVALRIEPMLAQKRLLWRSKNVKEGMTGTVDAVALAVVETAEKVGAVAIIALTETGLTARMVARFHPEQPIVAITPNERTFRKLALSSGCFAGIVKGFRDMDKVVAIIDAFVARAKIARKGEKVLITAGIPFGKVGGTNTLLVHTIRGAAR